MKFAKGSIWGMGLAAALHSVAHAQMPSAAQGSVRLPEPAQTTSDAATPVSAADEQTTPGGDEMVYLNVQDQDIKDIIKQISKATKRNFIIDDKVRGKVTIMSEKMMTREEAYQAFLSALEVAGFTVVAGPGGILKVVAQKDAISAPIPIHVDSTPYTDSFITRLITLQNISALEMSNAIKGLISKSGNLFAYPATNTLIITDTGTNIDRLMKLIKELDQEGPQQIIEIIPVKYADARTVATTVLNLFESEGGGVSGGGSAPRGAAARRPAGGESSDVKEVSAIIADERTNSIIVLASKRAIAKVRDIIARLDTTLQTGDSNVHVHYLKHANAVELAQTLSSMTSGSAASRRTSGGAGGAAGGAGGAAGGGAQQSAVAQFEGGVTVGADEATNALIITASAKDYNTLVEGLISKLDIPRRQVYLESMIMELSIDRNKEAGTKGFGGGAIGSLLGFGQTFAATGGLANLFTTGGAVGGVISQDTVTVNVPTATGAVNAVQLPAYAAFLNFIQKYSSANVVASPNIMTVDNQEAEINITEKIYANSQTITSTGVVTNQPTPLEAGLVLKLTPQISEGNAVRLKIEQELSNFFGPANAQNGARDSRKRKVSTTVVAQDGQTIVLGGLMQDEQNQTKDKVPILGDIPVLGLLFSTNTNTVSKKNLLIFITPHVVRDPADFSEITRRKLEQRNQFLDANFGAKQRKVIQDTLRIHRADLLEFSDPVPPSPGTKPPTAALPSAAPAAYAPPAPSAALPASASAPGAVITVPSVDAVRQSPPNVAPPAAPSSKSSRVQPPSPPVYTGASTYSDLTY